MKSEDTSKKFPTNPAEWEKLIAEAPGQDRPLTAHEEEAWSNAVIVREGGHSAVREALAEKRRRGPNRRPTKEQVAIRFSPEVLTYFRSTGKGWQTRMDEALKEWVRSHQ